jgi:hypothetical protein
LNVYVVSASLAARFKNSGIGCVTCEGPLEEGETVVTKHNGHSKDKKARIRHEGCAKRVGVL